jgi:DNA-binding MarR family transcriptional regulator
MEVLTMMDREKFVENLLTFVPMMFKKIMKGFPNLEVSKLQLELLFKISNEDRKPMSYYSEKMMIPKSNLTVISDKLIEEGFIERVFDPSDRRVIFLMITDKGQGYLCEHKKRMKQEMIKKLDAFSDVDIKRLNELIEEMRTILEKMDQQ